MKASNRKRIRLARLRMQDMALAVALFTPGSNRFTLSKLTWFLPQILEADPCVFFLLVPLGVWHRRHVLLAREKRREMRGG